MSDIANKQSAELDIFKVDGYTGFENVDNNCITVPFLTIAQEKMAQLSEEEDAYIPDLKLGDFFSSTTGKVFGNKVRFIALGFYHHYVIWGKKRGDYRGSFLPSEFEANEKSKYRQEGMKLIQRDTNGDLIQRAEDTRTFFILLPDFPEEGVLIFSLSSSGIKHSQRFLSKAANLLTPAGKKAPMFSAIWEMETMLNKNDEGSWYQIGDKKVTKVTFQEFISDPIIVKLVIDAIPVVKNYLDNAGNISFAAEKQAEEEETGF